MAVGKRTIANEADIIEVTHTGTTVGSLEGRVNVIAGGAIASTADPSKNRFSTGSLSVTDLVGEAGRQVRPEPQRHCKPGARAFTADGTMAAFLRMLIDASSGLAALGSAMTGR